jgi:hypothetical protein
MEMTLVKSLHSGDPDLIQTPRRFASPEIQGVELASAIQPTYELASPVLVDVTATTCTGTAL